MAEIKKLDDDAELQFVELTHKLAVKLLKENVAIEDIRNITGCSFDEILKIKNHTLWQ